MGSGRCSASHQVAALSAMPTIATAGTRPRQPGLRADDRGDAVGDPAPEARHAALERVVQAEALGEQQTEGVFVRLDEIEVGTEAEPQALLVAVRQRERALQVGGELAELQLQQRAIERVLGGEVLVEDWFGDR